MMRGSLLEQARRQAKGQSLERNDWNEVTVGNKVFTMEYPLNSQNNQLKIEEIPISLA